MALATVSSAILASRRWRAAKWRRSMGLSSHRAAIEVERWMDGASSSEGFVTKCVDNGMCATSLSAMGMPANTWKFA